MIIGLTGSIASGKSTVSLNVEKDEDFRLSMRMRLQVLLLNRERL